MNERFFDSIKGLVVISTIILLIKLELIGVWGTSFQGLSTRSPSTPMPARTAKFIGGWAVSPKLMSGFCVGLILNKVQHWLGKEAWDLLGGNPEKKTSIPHSNI